jgi:hypothetical protein
MGYVGRTARGGPEPKNSSQVDAWEGFLKLGGIFARREKRGAYHSPAVDGVSTARPTFVSVRPLPQESVRDGRLFANRRELIAGLHLRPSPVVVEIGVAFGDFSNYLVDTLAPSQFVGLDTFELHKVPTLWGEPSSKFFNGTTHLEHYESRMAMAASKTKLRIVQGDSSAEMSRFPDAYFDLIYIDGDHTHEGVVRDADISVRKVTRNGVLVFNDYIMYDHLGGAPFGVVPVVNDLCNNGWRVVGFAFHESMFCDIALTPPSQ